MKHDVGKTPRQTLLLETFGSVFTYEICNLMVKENNMEVKFIDFSFGILGFTKLFSLVVSLPSLSFAILAGLVCDLEL